MLYYNIIICRETAYCIIIYYMHIILYAYYIIIYYMHIILYYNIIICRETGKIINIHNHMLGNIYNAYDMNTAIHLPVLSVCIL